MAWTSIFFSLSKTCPSNSLYRCRCKKCFFCTRSQSNWTLHSCFCYAFSNHNSDCECRALILLSLCYDKSSPIGLVGLKITPTLIPSPTFILKSQFPLASKRWQSTEQYCLLWFSLLPLGYGGWSQEGCWAVMDNSATAPTGRYTCQCNHLTNFAMLMVRSTAEKTETSTIPPLPQDRKNSASRLQYRTVRGPSLPWCVF